ncbi:hypothetical protein BE20_00105 [Sorangium cellulosum]|nr:hypothetical protein BE20_00105 [Sorangium cellulosum]
MATSQTLSVASSEAETMRWHLGGWRGACRWRGLLSVLSLEAETIRWPSAGVALEGGEELSRSQTLSVVSSEPETMC